MKFFLDTANVKEIQEAASLGLLTESRRIRRSSPRKGAALRKCSSKFATSWMGRSVQKSSASKPMRW